MQVNTNSGVPPQWNQLRNVGATYAQPDPDQLAAVEATLQAIPMAAVAHTLDYRLVAINQDSTTLLRLAPGQIAGRMVRDFIPQSDQARALGLARTVVSATGSGARPTSSLRRLLTGDGQELTCWLHVGIAVIAGYECFIACIDLVNPVLSEAHRWRYRAEHDELTGLRRRLPGRRRLQGDQRHPWTCGRGPRAQHPGPAAGAVRPTGMSGGAAVR